MKINWKAIGAGAITAVGILSSPAVLALLPAKAAGVVTAIGAVLQLFSPHVATPARSEGGAAPAAATP